MSAARAVVLQHQDDAPPGLLLDALEQAGLGPQVLRLDRGDPLPDPASIALAASLGAGASVNDARPGWIATELEWLTAADRAGTPILGLCFGGQALAVALGGRVGRARSPERGWVSIHTAKPELVPPGPWLAWHDDQIALPPEAELLAENESGPQAFRLRRHLGLQFHPEVTTEIVEDWVRGAGDDELLDSEAMLEATAREATRAARDAGRLFQAFVESALDDRASSRSRSR